MPFTQPRSDGRPAICSKYTFVQAVKNREILRLGSFEEVFADAERMVRAEAPNIDGNAFNNARGSWYEWLIALGAIEYAAKHTGSNYLVKLPNISSYDCAKLYESRIEQLIQDLRIKVAEAGVSLITSNPDFVVIRRDTGEAFSHAALANLSEEGLSQVDSWYQAFNGRCSFTGLLGYVAAKSSLRPDRRLQIAHEGSLVKALYKHIQTRDWIISPQGIRYYALTSSVGQPDIEALKTVATHSITDVSSKPQAAVDGVFKVSTGQELEAALSQILS